MTASEWSREVDVVVVGSGVAGISVALGVAGTRRVLVLSKGTVDAGSTSWAQGGIAAAIGPGDDPAEHAADTATAGIELCDETALRCLVEEGPQRVAELLGAGARFDRDAAGRLSLTREGGHGRSRIVHAGGDATGAEVARVLAAAVRRAGIDIVEHAEVLEVTRKAGPVGAQATGVRLALGPAEAPRQGTVSARAVVLATGGIGHAYAASTNPPAVTGDGIALALRAGASLVDMEFVQFHPTVLWTGPGRRGQLPLVSEAVRGEGAVLIDAAGRRIMARRHPLADLAPRDVVAREISAAMAREAVDHVFLDATGLGAATLPRRFPTVLAACARAGIDPVRDPIPVAPAQHFLCGGVRTDRWGATEVPGLFAVGETAATGVHGANRLASNSLLEGLVFGRRVAARLVLDLPAPARGDSLGGPSGAAGSTPTPTPTAAAAAAIQALLSQVAGVRRNGPALRAAEAELTGFDGPLPLVARAVVAAALARRESRGCHWRSDYPATRHGSGRIVLRLDDDGALTTGSQQLEAAA